MQHGEQRDESTKASWRSSELKAEQFPLSGEVKGLCLDCIMIDVLHTVDQGFASHIIGNIMWECVAAHRWGLPTQAENVAALTSEMTE